MRGCGLGLGLRCPFVLGFGVRVEGRFLDAVLWRRVVCEGIGLALLVRWVGMVLGVRR